MNHMSYGKFVGMMLISFLVMYIVMFLNVDKIAHYHSSLSRIYMAILMVAPMAIIMMGMMGKMYPNKKLNGGIMLGGVLVFVLTLFALRKQVPVGDVQYMKAMIPHHSSAIMTSKNATISDPEVKALSEKIIRSQEEEIAQMEAIIKRMQTNN